MGENSGNVIMFLDEILSTPLCANKDEKEEDDIRCNFPFLKSCGLWRAFGIISPDVFYVIT